MLKLNEDVVSHFLLLLSAQITVSQSVPCTPATPAPPPPSLDFSVMPNSFSSFAQYKLCRARVAFIRQCHFPPGSAVKVSRGHHSNCAATSTNKHTPLLCIQTSHFSSGDNLIHSCWVIFFFSFCAFFFLFVFLAKLFKASWKLFTLLSPPCISCWKRPNASQVCFVYVAQYPKITEALQSAHPLSMETW